MSPTTRRRAVASLGAALALPLASATAAAAAPKPDLVVTTLSNPPASVAVGGTFKLRDTVLNRGAGRAGTSATRFYLTADVKRSLRDRVLSKSDPRTSDADVLLGGARDVPALRAGQRSRARRASTVRVPIGTRAGTYGVLACADDRATVRESGEDRNCRAATRGVTVVAAPDDSAIVALSDEFEQPDEAQDTATLQLFAATSCKATAPVRRMTTRRAITSVRTALTQRAGADALRAFAASPEHRSAEAAQEASVLALTAGRPGAALAAVLRAHELQPGRAAHLRNAAALAAGLGLPSEALALLDGAARLDDQPLAGMGIAPRAAALAVRGQALALLGQWPQARAALQAAVAQEPLLAEAERGLAAAAACTRAEDPLSILRRSRLRRTPVPPLDLLQGREHALRKLVLPFSPEQAAPMRDVYRDETDALHREGERLVAQRTKHESDLRAAEPTTSRAELRRRSGVMKRIVNAHRAPDIQAAQQRVDELTALAEATVHGFWGNADVPGRYGEFQEIATNECQGAPEGCFEQRMRDQCIPALRLAHQTWVDQVNDVWRAADGAHRLFSKRVSGYGAHLAGAPANGLVRTTIEEDEHAMYFAARATVIGWTVPLKGFEDHCVSAPEPAGLTMEQGAAAAADACPSLLRGVNLVAKAGAFSLKVSCDAVQVGGKIDAMPWLSGFAEATYDPRAGRMTVFAGSKGEIDALKVVKGAFKSGVYLTVSNDGLEDIGWRTGPSASASQGPFEVKLFKDEIDMSFVGAFNHLLGQ